MAVATVLRCSPVCRSRDSIICFSVVLQHIDAYLISIKVTKLFLKTDLCRLLNTKKYTSSSPLFVNSVEKVELNLKINYSNNLLLDV